MLIAIYHEIYKEHNKSIINNIEYPKVRPDSLLQLIYDLCLRPKNLMLTPKQVKGISELSLSVILDPDFFWKTLLKLKSAERSKDSQEFNAKFMELVNYVNSLFIDLSP